jgi:hypothetical protein
VAGELTFWAAQRFASSDDLAGDKRRAFVVRVATNDWDAVLMTRSAPAARRAVAMVLDLDDVYDSDPWRWRDVADDALGMVKTVCTTRPSRAPRSVRVHPALRAERAHPGRQAPGGPQRSSPSARHDGRPVGAALGPRRDRAGPQAQRGAHA